MTTSELVGWVCDPERPEIRQNLIVTLDDELLGRVVADTYRADLEKAEIGDGRYGYHLRFDTPLAMLKPGVLRVRRESDGRDAPSSPKTWTPPAVFDDLVERDLGRVLDRYGSDGDIDRQIDFLVGRVSELLKRRADRDGQREERRGQRDYVRRWRCKIAGGGDADEEGPPKPRSLRALVIDAQMPRADRDAGSTAVLGHIESLRRLGFEVGFAAWSAFGRPLAPDAAADLDALGVVTFGPPYYGSVEELMTRQSGEFDLVYLHRAQTADCYGALARAHFPKARIVYSVADLHHLRLARQAAAEDRSDLARVAASMRRRELMAMARADAVITHSKAEAAIIAETIGSARCHVVPWSRPAKPVSTSFRERRGLAFIGHYGHPPNVDAAIRLLEEIMPQIRAVDSDIECLLVGEGLPPRLRDLCGDGCVAVGRVEKLSQIFDRVRLTVAPLAYGAGIKGKVLDSLAAGVPCVCTPIAAEGLDLPESLRRFVVEDADGLVSAILALHANADENAAFARAGLEFMAAHFSNDVVDTRLRAAAGGVPSGTT